MEYKLEDIKLSQQDTFHRLFEEMDYSRENESWNFLNLWMWWKPFGIKAVIREDVIVCAIPPNPDTPNDGWFLRPICKKENLNKFYEIATTIAGKENIYIYNAHKELMDELEKQGYKVEVFERTEDLDEYFYDAEKLRTFAGKKLQKKRNLLNRFKKDYEGRWEYKSVDHTNIPELTEVMNAWYKETENDDKTDYFKFENMATLDAINHISDLKNVKAGGIYIDGKMKAFSIAEMPSPDFININIEKSTKTITGLYQVLVSEFLKNEGPEVKYVSREDAAEDEGLKKSKMSYRPIKVVEKYDIKVSR